jgi:hypothetical protein
MTRGAVLFAHNTEKLDYFLMAENCAKRITTFLDIPVTLITDENSIPKKVNNYFDDIILVEPDKSNLKESITYINKGRFNAFEYSPYDETIVIDVDYIINSDKLLKTFDLPTDFACHDSTSFLMQPNLPQEVLSSYSFNTLWASVMMFRKTKKVKQIFQCLEMVQNNFKHYSELHHFVSPTYRNDYALTIAVNIINGHLKNKSNIIPWNLLHVGKNTKVIADEKSNINTKYIVIFDHWKKGKIKKEYIKIEDIDFHMFNKDNLLELIYE